VLPYVVFLLFGFLLDVLWSRTPGVSEEDLHSRSINARYDFASILEHYHWAIGLMIIYLFIPFTGFLGLATALIISEWTGDIKHPFAVGKSHFKGSSIVGLILAFLLFLLYIVGIL